MSAARLVGLGGHLRAGKDAVADYLVDSHGFLKLGMSDPLHEAMLVIDPIIGETDLYIDGYNMGQKYVPRYSDLIGHNGYVEAKKNPEVRRLLQQLGTEFGRKMIGENVWVDIAKRTILDHLAEGRSVAITGIRYPNELTMIRDLGGVTWWVDRPGGSAAVSVHASENSVAERDFDFTLNNTGTLDHLYEIADRALEDKEKAA